VTIQAVVFDIGETLLDDSREFGAWADWLGVPRHTFSAVLGAVTAEGRNNAETFQYFRPGFDLAAERQRRDDAGSGEQYGEEDLYPDARPALSRLRQMGLWVGIAGNQTARAGQILRGLDLPADLVGTSAEWGAAKPDPAFFAHVIEVRRASRTRSSTCPSRTERSRYMTWRRLRRGRVDCRRPQGPPHDLGRIGGGRRDLRQPAAEDRAGHPHGHSWGLVIDRPQTPGVPGLARSR
jgi:N-acetyl-D-muramate 6-phosphate phosphatase